MIKGIDVLVDSIRVNVDQQVHAADLRHVIAEQVHLLEFPASIHMH